MPSVVIVNHSTQSEQVRQRDALTSRVNNSPDRTRDGHKDADDNDGEDAIRPTHEQRFAYISNRAPNDIAAEMPVVVGGCLKETTVHSTVTCLALD